MYDVIVIGGRCGGAPTAMLLARQGFRVLVVERSEELTDTLSTHFLWPRATSYLNRWGLLQKVLSQTPSATDLQFIVEDIPFLSHTPRELVEARLQRVHGEGAGATDQFTCVRRRVLDPILAEGAREAGVEWRQAWIEGLLQEDGRVVGVRGRTHEGVFEARARYVVGADGRGSVVARSLGLEEQNVQRDCSFAYWTYFAGVTWPWPTIQKRGRLAMAMVPTNFGAAMTLVWGPREWYPRFRQNPAQNYLKVLSFVSPEVGERVRRDGKQVERFWGTAEQMAYQRQSVGAGWLLVGDAACFKDQCGAIGITHAFRDAELASQALATALRENDDSALERYAQAREADVQGNFEFVCGQAQMKAPGELEAQTFSGTGKG